MEGDPGLKEPPQETVRDGPFVHRNVDESHPRRPAHRRQANDVNCPRRFRVGRNQLPSGQVRPKASQDSWLQGRWSVLEQSAQVRMGPP
jgi:hypothetical protein